jgi:hypothetical protein
MDRRGAFFTRNTMILHDLLAKARARVKTGDGWTARCPAHDDRSEGCWRAVTDAEPSLAGDEVTHESRAS